VIERALGGGDGAFAALLRAAVLLGESSAARRDLLAELRGLCDACPVATPAAADAVRRALLEILLHGDRTALIDALDESLLGLRPRPTAAGVERPVAV
jgi:hypothetical protein